ncbi:MAG: RICIN domain-containing protein [Aquisalimonadaceae bacterium]
MTLGDITSGYWRIAPRGHEHVFDVSLIGEGVLSGNVYLHGQHDGENQQFRFVAAEDGYYRIEGRHDGTVLSVRLDYADEIPNNVCLLERQDSDNQLFRLEEANTGEDAGPYFAIIAKYADLALCIEEFTLPDGRQRLNIVARPDRNLFALKRA